MCGICGIAGVSSNLENRPGMVDRARETLYHRGPDDAGTWRAPDGHVALAMRRLSIVDLTDCGHQPMQVRAGDEQLTLVFNGEIYNHNALRAELASLGHSFRGHSDTEVVLAAYLQWGTRCVARFVGMFALALFDPRSRELFLARDRAGEKPLFYSHQDGRLSFASELAALMEDDRLVRRMSLEGLNHYLAFGYTRSDQSILDGVMKLPPAHAMVYDLRTDALRIWPYWSLPARTAPRHGSLEDLTRELESLLEESVKGQMQADVPVAIMLSGGIDSSVVTALAARSVTDVRTFTVSMPGQGNFDEGPSAGRIASYLGTQHTQVDAEPTSVELLPELSRKLSEPIADSSLVPTYLISRLIRQHAKVALGGDGGDELFGGYPHHSWAVQHDLMRKVGRSATRRLANAALQAMPLGIRGRNYVAALTSNSHDASGRMGQYFDVEWRARISPLLRSLPPEELGYPEVQKALIGAQLSSSLQRATTIDFTTYLADDVLAKVDRASMLTSLEVRAPWLDHRIVEFAFSRVPDDLRSTLGRTKILPRALAARLLPPELVSRRKQGFSIPLNQWFKGEWGAFMEEVIRGAPPELIDPAAVSELVALQRKGLSHTHRLFTLTMLELWRREWKVGAPVPA